MKPARWKTKNRGKLSPSQELQQLFAPHDAFLATLNEIANAFKHSFINTDMTVVGSEYPVVFALVLKRNKLSESPQFYSVNFAEMVVAFSNFYKQVIATIQQWATLAKDKNDGAIKVPKTIDGSL